MTPSGLAWFMGFIRALARAQDCDNAVRIGKNHERIMAEYCVLFDMLCARQHAENAWALSECPFPKSCARRDAKDDGEGVEIADT